MQLSKLLLFRRSCLLSALPKSKMKSFIFWFSNEHTNFRIPELEALFRLFGINQEILKHHRSAGPFLVMDFPSEDLPRKLMSRSVLAHTCYELWSEADSLDGIHSQLKANLSIFEPFNTPTSPCSFRFRVDTFGKVISHPEKLSLIDTFEYIPLNGKVDLVNPDLSLHLLQYYGLDPNNAPEKPFRLFLGRWIADGQRRLAFKLSLKARKFIGNTSMDPLLSLLMANLAGIDNDDVVCDPFVGSGSLLVAAAQMGAHVCGGDIDYLMLHARTRSSRARQECREEDESVRANFIQYGLESKYLDVLVNDSSKPVWRSDFKFDAIITDPPYGLRESCEKIGTQKGYKIKEEHLASHIPSKLNYKISEIYKDLINFASKHLVINGRLICWIPVSRADYEPSRLPHHPCFKLTTNCEQQLTAWASRRLLVFEKISEPTETCETTIDNSTSMYRVKFFEGPGVKCRRELKERRERKRLAHAQFGAGSKCGNGSTLVSSRQRDQTTL